jgi:hypothetical protein
MLLAAVLAPQGTPAPQPATTHWAYTAPRPSLPPRDGHPVDAFLDATLAREHLDPTPPADRATLLRRVTFDLTGLPPTPDELDAFLADTRADAWERVVDRLLASPHYGERQALLWLDLARYGDSQRLQLRLAARDVEVARPADRPAEPRRAVRSLHAAAARRRPVARRRRGRPHRQRLPPQHDAQRRRRRRCRGARWERLLDRATTTATVWLGATWQCAQCHDHKYDPISQREFFGLVAFFEPDAEETLELPTAAQAERRDQARAELQRLEAAKAGKDAIAAAKKALAAATVDSTLVLRHRPDVPATTALRIRGAYDARGDVVPAGVPAALGPPLPDGPRDRLALARWLVRPDHPLTARVHVNRLWGELFGRPLVATPEDFGTMGARPDHPELLDWLAGHFVRSGWSQKALLRLLVTSAAYQRSAAATPALRERDPDNRWLARGARFRLPAEHLRDLQLAASGLLVPTIGGPSVFPLQADTSGVVPVNKTDMRWRVDNGPGRHRRGLYTFWRRTATFVQFAVFDAPSREQCTVMRQRTNTPLQALTGLNDPAAWEAAEALGKRMAAAPGDDRARLAFGFRLCTSRRPDAEELDVLAGALAAEPEAQRWTLVANALLNLDETLSR